MGVPSNWRHYDPMIFFFLSIYSSLWINNNFQQQKNIFLALYTCYFWNASWHHQTKTEKITETLGYTNNIWIVSAMEFLCSTSHSLKLLWSDTAQQGPTNKSLYPFKTRGCKIENLGAQSKVEWMGIRRGFSIRETFPWQLFLQRPIIGLYVPL